MMTAEEIIQACSHIPSSVFEPEQEMWWRKLKDLPGNPVIVDFGTGHGKSTASLALACPQGTVYTFDPGLPYINAGCSPSQYEAETNKFILDTGAINFVFTPESSLEKPWDKEIDVLNIDSDHTYETSKAEILRWIPFVKVGGIVFFHDYEHPRCPGVKQAIDELIPSKFNMELLEVTDAGQVKCACFKKL
jgi:hypothetical protein